MTLTSPTPASYWQHVRVLNEGLRYGVTDLQAVEQLWHIVNYGATAALRKAAYAAVKEASCGERRDGGVA